MLWLIGDGYFEFCAALGTGFNREIQGTSLFSKNTGQPAGSELETRQGAPFACAKYHKKINLIISIVERRRVKLG
jgi:hypothetical protein